MNKVVRLEREIARLRARAGDTRRSPHERYQITLTLRLRIRELAQHTYGNRKKDHA